MKGLTILAASAAKTQPDVSIWSWATVTDDSPLRVQLDTDDTPLDMDLDIARDSLVAALAVDDRVWVQLVSNANPSRRHRRLVIIGRAGG
jgi:hypothetical protein